MSRIGKQKIVVPAGTKVELLQDSSIVATGKFGSNTVPYFKDFVEVVISGSDVEVKPLDVEKSSQFWGLQRSLIDSAVKGVTTLFEKKLEVVGVGYKVDKKGNGISLKVGFSHAVEFDPPEGVQIEVEKNVITVKGANNVLVGDTAAKIRNIRKPNPYKGKGIRYVGEEIKLKPISTGGKK
jgi:large subunit ribosomal protein L6